VEQRRTVVIVYRRVPQYRRDFFSRLRDRLSDARVDLRVLHGSLGEEYADRGDEASLRWGTPIRSWSIHAAGHSLVWQSCLRELRDADLVIVQPDARVLTNYVLFAMHRLHRMRVAFWGHGKNFDELAAIALAESVKRYMGRRVHWWFAYNDLSADTIAALGFPRSRITSVENAIDTEQLRRWRDSCTRDEIDQVVREYDLANADVGIFCGSMYPQRRIQYLLEAAHCVHADNPRFQLLLVGAGPSAELARGAAQDFEWIHYAGTHFGRARVPLFLSSKVTLMPVRVGLGILDSFVLEVPLLTCDAPDHGPEIGYLESGTNGLMVPFSEDPRAYARPVLDLLRDETRRRHLQEGCRRSAQHYTLENMVERFAAGVEAALAD
jgi:glycosyltransferase involved in cell wall biosynthesis